MSAAYFDGNGAMWTVNARAAYRWPVRLDEAAYEIGPPEKVVDMLQDSICPRHDKSGNVFAVAQFSQGTLVIHRAEKNRVVRLQPQYDVRYVAVSPDGKWVAATSNWEDGSGVQIKIWDASTGKLVQELPITKARWHWGFSPDNRWLTTTTEFAGREVRDRKENFHRLWEVGTWNEAGTIPTLGIPFWEHDVILEGQRDGTIVISQISTRKELARLSSPEPGRIHPHIILPSGFLIASGDETGRSYYLDLPRIRRQLAEMGLDWDGPPYFSEEQIRFARSPYTVRVDAGVLADDDKK